jgi:GNAT superfamily N-acetyltransferase
MQNRLGLNCRSATVDDGAVVTEFSRLCALDSEDLALDPGRVGAGVEAALRDPDRGRYYLAENLAENGSEAVGQIMITREWSDWRNAWIWWIQSVYVRPDARRRGVFTTLLEYVCEEAARAQATFLRLYVDKTNQRAENTYLERGFVPAHYRMLEKTLDEPRK